MNGCTDRRISEMLYAYELDLLDDSERAEVEAHLLECTHCFRRASTFEHSAQMISRDPVVREAVLNQSLEQVTPRTGRSGAGKRGLIGVLLSGRMIPSYAIAAVLLILLLVQPWGIRFSPTDDVYAVEDRLAVVNFGAEGNDRGKLSQITTHLLITDLSETGQLRVVSSERLIDALHGMGLEGGSAVSPDIASKVARQTRARWILTGTVLQTEPTIIVEGRLVDIRTDSVIVSRRIEGLATDDIFSVVDRLSAEVAQYLGPADAVPREDARPVKEMTTASTEAYRHYLEGREAMLKVYIDDAARSFREAIELDSTFAMAYYNLAVLSTGSERMAMIRKAEEHSGHATRKDRFYIRCRLAQWSGDTDGAIAELEDLIAYYGDDRDALQLLGQLEYDSGLYGRAIVRFSRAIEMDSQYTAACNMLAYAYRAIGDRKAAERALDRYTELAPDEANPYDTRGSFLWQDGEVDLAMIEFNKAIERKPDFYPARRALARILMDRKQFGQATEHLAVLTDSDDPSVLLDGLLGPVHLLLVQGRLKAALDELDGLTTGDRSIVSGPDSIYIAAATEYLRAQILVELGDCGAAKESLLRSLEGLASPGPTYRLTPDAVCARILAGCESLGVESIARMCPEIGLSDSTRGLYWTVRGAAALSRQDFSEAAILLEKADGYPGYHPLLLLGEAYVGARRYDRAIANLRPVVEYYKHEWSALSGIAQIRAHYYLGLAYEESNWNERAVAQYQQFLEFWGEADTELHIVNDARRRLTRLKSGA